MNYISVVSAVGATDFRDSLPYILTTCVLCRHLKSFIMARMFNMYYQDPKMRSHKSLVLKSWILKTKRLQIKRMLQYLAPDRRVTLSQNEQDFSKVIKIGEKLIC